MATRRPEPSLTYWFRQLSHSRHAGWIDAAAIVAFGVWFGYLLTRAAS